MLESIDMVASLIYRVTYNLFIIFYIVHYNFFYFTLLSFIGRRSNISEDEVYSAAEYCRS